jgi:hypothetical protein
MQQVFETVSLTAIVLVMAQASGFATVVTDVPEITPGSLSAALGLLAGGVLILRARLRSK